MTRFSQLKMQYWRQQNADPLPAGYRRVEYLESTGVQWIDTGFIGAGGSAWGFKFKGFHKNDLDASGKFGCIFGARHASGVRDFQLTTFKKSTYTGGTLRNGAAIFGVSDFSAFLPAANVVFTASLADGTYTAPNGNTYNVATEVQWDTYALHVFGLNTAGADVQRGIGCAVYLLELSNNGVLERNFVPCVRESDNKPGMYDLCGSSCPLTGTPFYVNSGTGADFTWGELS